MKQTHSATVVPVATVGVVGVDAVTTVDAVVVVVAVATVADAVHSRVLTPRVAVVRTPTSRQPPTVQTSLESG